MPRAQRFIRRVLTPEEIEACLRSEKRGYIKAILDRNPAEESAAARALAKAKYDKKKKEKVKQRKIYEEVLREASRFLAGRWAAKEAGIKAHSWRAGVGLREVEFVDAGEVRGGGGGGGGEEEVQEQGDPASWWPVDRGNGSEAPTVVIRGTGDGVRDQVALMSISHDGDYATAVCLGFNPSWEGSWGPISNNETDKGRGVELNGMRGVGLESKKNLLATTEGEGEVGEVGEERSAEIVAEPSREVAAGEEIDLEKAFAGIEETEQEDTAWVEMMEGKMEEQEQTVAAVAKPAKKEPKKRTWTYKKGKMIVQVPRNR